MAKMFYTVEEAAEKLGVSSDEVRQMASDRKLQQFRDRDKLMFKREQVDQLAEGGDAAASAGPGDDTVADTVAGAPSADAGDTDAIDLRSDSTASGETSDRTGVDVFQPEEVADADPKAQTQVTSSPPEEEEEMVIESVGSGSGLLDLTRESDDTSLGAELLDEIKPGGDSGASIGSGLEAASMETGASGPSGLENLSATEEPAEPDNSGEPGMAVSYAAEPDDPAGNGLGAGMLLVCMAALIVGLVVSISAVGGGARSSLMTFMTESSTNYYLVIGGLAVLAIVAGAVGLFLGKALQR